MTYISTYSISNHFLLFYRSSPMYQQDPEQLVQVILQLIRISAPITVML
jgi:hypothetical protein